MADQQSLDSREGLVRRRNGAASSIGSSRDGQQMYQPGMPIGYLAARGTPYERKYFTRKLGFCCLFLAPPILLVTLAITLVPVLYAIANHALHTSVFQVEASNITSPTNTSFPLTLQAQVKKVGIFPATIYFREPIDVYWNTPPPNMREVKLGSFNLARVSAAAGHGLVNQATFFEIADEDAFGIFSGWLVSMEEFTWRIKSKNLHVEAFSFFPTYKALEITKDIVIKGINNFGNKVELLDLQLPGADPAGGIQVITTTLLDNPSPFGIQVGTLDLDLFYMGHYLGPVSVDGLNLTAGPNVVTLTGRVLPYPDNTTALTILGNLFTNYINSIPSDVVAVGRSVREANGEVISWLAQGIVELNAHVNFVPPEPINPIKDITIETINLVYSEETPYNPVLSSQNLTSVFQLPFGFPLNITSLATQLSIYMDGAAIGSATGDFAPSDTIITVLSEKQTAGTIDLTLPNAQLILPNNTDAAKKQLIAFQNNFVFTDGTGFQTEGAARTITQTPLGEILLDGIKFKVNSGLRGLQGLTKYPTIINSVDVTGGTAQAVDLVVGLTVINPSNLNLSTGDTVLELARENVVLGYNTLPNLMLLPGRNDINATATFDPNVSPVGIDTLNRFISGLDTVLDANGFNGSSQIVSLTPSLEGLRLNTTLPALQKSLVQSANLTVLTSTGVTNDIADSTVYISNPFTSGLTITRIASNASAYGIFLANINTNLQFTAAGKSTSASPNVPLSLNLYPPDLFAVLRAFAVQSGQNPAYIDGLVQLAGFTLSPVTESTNTKRSLPEVEERDSFTFEEDDEATQAQMAATSNPGVYFEGQYNSVEEDGAEFTKRALPLTEENKIGKRDNLYTGFNLETYVARAFSVATADLVIEADTTIGEYGSTLTFSQNGVPLGTDDTLFLLLPVLAKPIVQAIVDGSILNIDRVTITEAQPASFTAALQGALTNAGPFDAVVSFPSGLSIYWQGQLLTQTAFPNITLTGDLGSAINVALEGMIPNVDYFTTFLKSAITDASFVWEIRGTDITVSALGIDVSGIALTKSVQLTGLNGLQGQVIINSFDLPFNDPAGGIHLTAISTINNPAQVGVALTQFGTEIYMGGTDLGPTAAANAFTLQALAVNTVPLAGRIQRQTSEGGLADLSELFTRFVHNQNTDLIVQGVYAGPSDVVWLNEGIKALRVQVVLPSQDFQVIRLISINQLALYFTVATAWNPESDSSDTSANFFLPFAFPVDITQVTGPFIANYQNTDMAVLNIPPSPVQTNVEARIIKLAFENVPFAVYDSSHRVFSQFSADFVASEQVTFNLHGTTTGNLNTAAGALTITDIPFDLNTNLLGLQGLNAKPALVSNLDVFHGYPTYLQINVDTTLFNPSDTTVGAGDVSFAVSFQDRIIGNALINNILLPPGDIIVPTGIQYMPIGADNVAAGQVLLENYVQNITSTAIVVGTSQTTPIESLQQALEQIRLSTSIPPLEQLLVQRAQLTVPRDIAQNGGIASTTVTLNNPFTADIFLLVIDAQANFQGLTIGTIDQNLAATNNIFYAPGKQVSTSNPIPFNIDIRPKSLINFILAAANAYGVSLGPLPPFFQKVLDLPGEASTQVVPTPDDSAPPCSGGNPFDTLGAILALLKPLAVSIPIKSTLKLDDYQTDLNFIQQPVPVGTDETALYLVGPAAAPLIQIIVDESVLTVTRANATSLTNEGFTTALIGSLLTDAPADAYIEVPGGLTVEFQGTDIATLTLPPLCTNVPDGIPNLSLTSQLTITNQDAFAEFAYYLLTEPNFTWRLYSNNVTVRTLGIKFSDVQLSKEITLDAFDGLPGIAITRFAATGDGSDGKSINIATDVAIPSLAALGVELGQATFDLFFGSTNIGQASSSGLFLAYKATTDAALTGFLRDQHGNSQGITDLGVLFTQYLSGANSTLRIQGNNVITPASGGQPVGWLTTAFKRFSTSTILPGMVYQIIYAITLSDLEVFLQTMNEDFNVPATNQHTVATFANPLEFSLAVLNLQPTITIIFEDIPAASLALPQIDASSGVSTGPTVKQDLNFGFTRQNVVAIDRTQFQKFFAQLTDFESANFVLNGSTAVTAQTPIGDIPIQGIPFNVTTSLKGINSFNNRIDLLSSSVDMPQADFLGVSLVTSLTNPSNLTVHTNDVSLPTFYTSTELGRAFITTLDLVPGNNTIPALFQLKVPTNGTAAATTVQDVLRQYVSTRTSNSLDGTGAKNTISLEVSGTDASGAVITDPQLSPYRSLDLALGGVKAATDLVGLGSLVIDRIRVYLPPTLVIVLLAQVLGGLLGQNAAQVPAYVYAYGDFSNALPSGIEFQQVYSNIYFPGDLNDPSQLYATVVDNFNGNNRDGIAPYDVPSLQPNSAGTAVKLNKILLTKGVAGSLPLLPALALDLNNIIQLNLFKAGDPSTFYPIPALPYYQTHVPTAYGLGDAGETDNMSTLPSSLLNLPANPTLQDLLGLANSLGIPLSTVVGGLQQLAGGNLAGALSSINNATITALCSNPVGSGLIGGLLGGSTAVPNPCTAVTSTASGTTTTTTSSGTSTGTTTTSGSSSAATTATTTTSSTTSTTTTTSASASST